MQVDCHCRQRGVIQAQLQRDRLKGPTSRRALPERIQLWLCQRQTLDQNLAELLAKGLINKEEARFRAVNKDNF